MVVGLAVTIRGGGRPVARRRRPDEPSSAAPLLGAEDHQLLESASLEAHAALAVDRVLEARRVSTRRTGACHHGGEASWRCAGQASATRPR